MGNFIGIYNVHTCNFFGLGIALLCVILEGVFLRNKECNSFNAFYEASLCSLTISDDGKSLRITVEF